LNDLRVGDALTLTAAFRASDVLTDPTTIALEVQDPSGNTASYTYAGAEITKNSTGTYSKQITFDEAGWWVYEWAATGTVVAVEGNKIYVRPQLI
jgi:hypothetical protein